MSRPSGHSSAGLAAGRPPQIVEYERTFRFSAPLHQVWEAVCAVDRYEEWWRWLSGLRVEGGGVAEGGVLEGWVAPPVPYRMRVSVAIDRVRPPSLVDATVDGDLRGRASLRLRGDGDCTDVTTAWDIEMMQPAMRVASRVAGPLLRWGHDRVVDMTVAGFRRRALPPEPPPA